MAMPPIKFTPRRHEGLPAAVVTGGAGFVGSNLCDRLLAEGYRVICVDNLQTGRKSNIRHLLGNADFTFMEHDVVEPLKLQARGIVRVYNLAGAASPPMYQRDPIHTLRTNVIGAINVLDLAKQTGARIFQASTSEVYGDPEVHPQPENYSGRVNCYGPRACYDEGKRAAETAFFEYRRQHDVDTRVARIFNTYGPRMSPEDGRVVSNFIVQALKGEDITIYGDGSQTRSFCFVDDLVEGIQRLMAADEPPTTPVNLGNPCEFTVVELAQLVLELTGSRSRIVHRPLPQDDPRQRRPNITKARELLHWQPAIALRDGLIRTIEHFVAELAGYA
ncbi:UDP-glucuronic acid decarboxylase family protein [Devosia sp.]|uniref:UDP-glucuronic acid decarboxylase family protein n=1 Tax=Devosia sp. TaxID=1871048 RepID=UPI001AC7F983|nr:UDP-glucuronic acid decarboxylase family protein [Devosia sp.]MBN9309999.1 SDR family oxidoreductase [Devosia sp.]